MVADGGSYGENTRDTHRPPRVRPRHPVATALPAATILRPPLEAPLRRQVISLVRHHPHALAVGGLLAVVVGAGLSGWLLGTTGAIVFLVAVQALSVAVGVEVLAHLLGGVDRLGAAQRRAARAARRERSAAERTIGAVDTAAGEFRAVRRRQVDRALRAGRSADQKGELDTALEHYRRALEWDPGARNVQRWHRRAVLGQVDQADGVSTLVRELDEQTRVENPAYALELAEAAYAQGVQHRDLLDRLIALRDHDGRADDALALTLDAATAHLRAFDGSPSETAGARRLDATARVMISGYFYSGSGAVKDHLRGVPATTVWPPAGELRVVKFPGGYADLGVRLSEQGELTTQDLVDHYLHLSGVKVSRKALGRYDRWRMVNADSRRLHRARPRSDGYLAALYRSYLDLARLASSGELDPDRLEAHTQAVLAAALDAVASADRTDRVVVDQIVTAWRIDIARYLPPSTFIIVHRDPRDQFAEVREVLSEPGRGKRKRTPDGFAAAYRTDRELVDGWVSRLETEYGHRVLRLAFEDFVLDHDRTADRLHDTLGIDGATLGDSGFDPAVSRRNVGKFRQHLDPAAVEVIETELAEYLHPEVG